MLHEYLALTDNREVAGSATVSFIESRNTFWISRIAVTEPYRGRGYGSQLLDRICADADKEGVNLSLSVSPPRNSSLQQDELEQWYNRRGFIKPSPDRSEMYRSPTTPSPIDQLSSIWSLKKST